MGSISHSNGSPAMTRREREDLARLARKHEKLERGRVDQRTAELLADFEAQMDTHYAWEDDGRWTEAVETAQKALEEAEAWAKSKIAARCDELGIPQKFRPGFHVRACWSSGGLQSGYDKVSQAERAQARRVVERRLYALAKQAKTTIEQRSLEVQTRLVADGLTSEAAQRFLGELPTAVGLMAPLDPEEVRELLPGGSP